MDAVKIVNKINKEKEALDEEQLTLMELWEELEGDDDSLD